MKSKRNKIIISILLSVISYGYIVYKLLLFKKFEGLSDYKISLNITSAILLLIVCSLMFLNWSIETIKWNLLINKIQVLKFKDSFKAVFSGITLGIFTPNRVGEIGGRVLFMDKGKRTFGLLATSLGSFAQFISTIITGLIGFELFLYLFPKLTYINPVFNKISSVLILFFLVLFFLVLFFIFYFNPRFIKPWLMRFQFFRLREEQLNYFSETESILLLKVLLLSLIRYSVFFIQFYLLLLFFNINIMLTQGFVCISLIYLFSTLIPTTTLIELGIRGSLSIFFLGLFTTNYLGIILSTTLLWIINLAIPSVIGSLFFIKKNLDFSNK